MAYFSMSAMSISAQAEGQCRMTFNWCRFFGARLRIRLKVSAPGTTP